MEIEILGRTAQQPIELPQSVQHPALKLRHLPGVDLLRLIEVVEVTEQVAQRVAKAAVGIDLVLDDLGPDAQILGIIRRHHP